MDHRDIGARRDLSDAADIAGGDEEITRVALPGAVSWKKPSEPVTVPRSVPFTRIETPTSGSPVADMIVPWTETTGGWAESESA